MIRVRDIAILKRIPNGAIVIDLEDAADQKDVLVRIAEKLPSQFSNTVDGTSIDYFVEIISDWMRCALPNSRHVIVLASKISLNGFVIAKVVAALHQAMLMALSQRFQDCEDFDMLKELRALRLDFYI